LSRDLKRGAGQPTAGEAKIFTYPERFEASDARVRDVAEKGADGIGGKFVRYGDGPAFQRIDRVATDEFRGGFGERVSRIECVKANNPTPD
jgi:hypothetical protein